MTAYLWKVDGQDRERGPSEVPDGEHAGDWIGAAWGVDPAKVILLGAVRPVTVHADDLAWVLSALGDYTDTEHDPQVARLRKALAR